MTNDQPCDRPHVDDSVWPALSSRIPFAVPTLRDQFAMAALTGIVSSNPSVKTTHPEYVKAIADTAYDFADEMLKAREARS